MHTPPFQLSTAATHACDGGQTRAFDSIASTGVADGRALSGENGLRVAAMRFLIGGGYQQIPGTSGMGSPSE